MVRGENKTDPHPIPLPEEREPEIVPAEYSSHPPTTKVAESRVQKAFGIRIPCVTMKVLQQALDETPKT